jgi:hypothetical protein
VIVIVLEVKEGYQLINNTNGIIWKVLKILVSINKNNLIEHAKIIKVKG